VPSDAGVDAAGLGPTMPPVDSDASASDGSNEAVDPVDAGGARDAGSDSMADGAVVLGDADIDEPVDEGCRSTQPVPGSTRAVSESPALTTYTGFAPRAATKKTNRKTAAPMPPTKASMEKMLACNRVPTTPNDTFVLRMFHANEPSITPAATPISTMPLS
jgi:hypothetical protein